jgi:triosephosphate isomerase (TIM)
MDKTFIIANWKMNLSPKEAVVQAKQITKKYKKVKNVEVVICPAFTEIPAIAKIVQTTGIKIGAQDVFYEEKGSFTGCISPRTLIDHGCDFAIVGHSERREYQNETDKTINSKIRAALENKLTPILCIGETFAERQAGQKESVLYDQVSAALKDVWLKENEKLIIAYEPVWVIGSGQAVDPDEADITQTAIRRSLLEFLPAGIVNENISVLYGGSVNKLNVKSFLDKPSIDGVLIGKASIDSEHFLSIIDFNNN